MIHSGNIRFCYYVLIMAIIGVSGITASAQNRTYDREFCSNNWSNGDKVSFNEVRESTLPSGSLTVDGKRNGGISVKGENRSDILIRACVRTWGTSDEEARSMAKNIRIETNGTIRAEGTDDEKNWSVSYEILVPRNTNLKLTTMNGGIRISDVDGNIEFEAKNGGIHLSNLAGSVKGRTTNGGVHIELTGNTWKGNGLDVETTNGGVHLSMSENYAARFETKTVNGGFRSEIAALNVEKKEDDRYRTNGVNISKDINGGGALIRVVTTNGGVKIESK
ncbi:hypothetical protein BH10ACI1_BH10ACI1_21170 [soil metagenome]